MENLRHYFPQFPEEGEQVTFLGFVFTYNRERNYWSHTPLDFSDDRLYLDNYFRSIYSTTTVFFSRTYFDWDTYNNVTFM
jgi:hypothetical protein